ncbi:MAG: hypothetical protein M1828_004420 [Chrysothrix sp. TS-e1954]|nr:MAG: hypothetical protein M1828_004420 [Chrysothrix sp. TS-e1954]
MRSSIFLGLASLASYALAAPVAAPSPTWGEDQENEAMKIAEASGWHEAPSCASEQFKVFIRDPTWDEDCNEENYFCYCSDKQAKKRNDWWTNYLKYNCYMGTAESDMMAFVNRFCANIQKAKPTWNWG